MVPFSSVAALWPLLCFAFQWSEVTGELNEIYRIGGIFDEEDEWSQYAVRAAIQEINEDSSLLPGIELELDIIGEGVSPFDVLDVEKKVCRLVSQGIVAIVGPLSPVNSNHVQSLCDTMEIPHISTRWDPHQRRSSCLINIYPQPSVLSKSLEESITKDELVSILRAFKNNKATPQMASADIVKAWAWEGFTLLYDDFNALRKMGDLLKIANDKGYAITVRQVKGKPGDENNFRHILQEVKHSEETNLVVEVSKMKLYDVLLQAQQVGLVGTKYNYIITSLDLHMIDLEYFKWAGTNITGLRLVNTDLTFYQKAVERMTALKLEDLGSNERRYKQESIPFGERNSKTNRNRIDQFKSESADMTIINIPPVESILLFDAIKLVAKALHNLDLIEAKEIDCRKKSAWETGYSVINYVKMSEQEGLSGKVQFDNEGFRSDICLDIIELTQHGLSVEGNWSTYGGVTILRQEPEMEYIEPSDDLRNSTFIVLIALTHPYGMLKESSERLIGNERFEGYGIDLIHELSELTGFNYTFRVQEDKSSGNPITLPNSTRVWNGMIGEVLAGRADLAIADLTITRERERDADFTMPFMNLGISILYRKPAAAPPSLFSFLSPFSYEVWCYVLSAYFGVSLLLYIMARISPQEWTNPYPCIEEPVELENQFSLSNSLWFTIGSLMQQGSEIAPIAASTRMAGSIWWFFTLIMVSSYTANLAAFLTIEQKVEAFRDVQELADHGTIRYGAKKGGSTANFFRDSSDPVYRKMWEFMSSNPDVMLDSNEAGVDRVDQNTDYAFLMESTSVEYETERRCNLFRVGKELDEKGYGIAMRQNSTYRNVLSKSVVKLQERGVLDEIKKKWWKEKRGGGSCQEDPPGDADDLGLDNVGGVFVVLLGGCILAIFLAFGELFFDIYFRENKVSFKEELAKEMKFIVRCHGTEKPNRKAGSHHGSTNGSRSSLASSRCHSMSPRARSRLSKRRLQISQQ